MLKSSYERETDVRIDSYSNKARVSLLFTKNVEYYHFLEKMACKKKLKPMQYLHKYQNKRKIYLIEMYINTTQS